LGLSNEKILSHCLNQKDADSSERVYRDSAQSKE